ncbi:hypothetical protein WJT74_04495 [Sphingomicrobium sp. XHP0239]|uniref:hypothetical protein n=1 Tax=Sphingomicrobium maritimum TaxID=3133972 RepID=UPI0031CC3BC9
MPTPTETDLPERTDRIVPGASKTATDLERDPIVDTQNNNTDSLNEPTGTTRGKARDKVVAKVSEARTTIAKEAAGKTRGMVGDGLSKGSETISSMSRLVSDTAGNIDESLGAEYGDYARSAAKYLDDTAQKIASKDPDELVNDVRDFVRKSPGMALGAAAVVGFALARVVSAGFDAERSDSLDDLGTTPPRDGDVPPIDPVQTPRV